MNDKRTPWSMEAIIEWAEELAASGEHRAMDLLDEWSALRAQVAKMEANDCKQGGDCQLLRKMAADLIPRPKGGAK